MQQITSVVLLVAAISLGTDQPIATPQTPFSSEVASQIDTIIEMQQLGFSEALIIAKIKSSRTAFDLSTEALKKLKLENAEIVEALLEISVNRNQIKPIIKRHQHKDDCPIAEQISQHHLEIAKTYFAYVAGD